VRGWPAALGTAGLLALAACEARPPGRSGASAPPGVASRSGDAAAPAPQAGPLAPGVRGDTPEGARFAEWVVSTDPERRYVLDAFVRDNRVLGVKVNPTMTKGQVQESLQSLLAGMRKAFPGRPLEVIAFYESGHDLARISFDPQTGQTRTWWRQ
jgi:hypothetical protein